MMNSENKQQTCQFCGAPIVSEICAYCGNATGLDTDKADMEYPVLDCNEVTLSFLNTWFPLIFVGAFGLPGFIVLMVSIFAFQNIIMLLMGLLFFIGGMITLSIVLRKVFGYLKVKKNGKTIQGTVYGYIDDNFTINGEPAQVVKLLVQTSNGPRFVLYKLGSTIKMYGINDKIDIMVYKNYFLIPKNKEVINW